MRTKIRVKGPPSGGPFHLGGGKSDGRSSTKSRGSVIASIAERTPSRPRPESWILSKGMLSTRKVGTSLTITAQTSRVSKALQAESSRTVTTPAFSP